MGYRLTEQDISEIASRFSFVSTGDSVKDEEKRKACKLEYERACRELIAFEDEMERQSKAIRGRTAEIDIYMDRVETGEGVEVTGLCIYIDSGKEGKGRAANAGVMIKDMNRAELRAYKKASRMKGRAKKIKGKVRGNKVIYKKEDIAKVQLQVYKVCEALDIEGRMMAANILESVKELAVNRINKLLANTMTDNSVKAMMLEDAHNNLELFKEAMDFLRHSDIALKFISDNGKDKLNMILWYKEEMEKTLIENTVTEDSFDVL